MVGLFYFLKKRPAAITISEQTETVPAEPQIETVEQLVEYLTVDQLAPRAAAGQTQFADAQHSIFDGEKFYGGFGDTQIQHIDYWTLRARSAQLFNNNLYARGLIRRLVTNEINTGLALESSPSASILGKNEDDLDAWTDDVETRFELYSESPLICDYNGEKTLGEIEQDARREALIAGDVLVVLRQSRVTGLPQVQLVSGDSVQTPFGDNLGLKKSHTIKHGVEQDPSGKTVAFWIKQKLGDFCRIPAKGKRTGRRLAWLVYGTDKRLDDLRGQPLLSLVLQSLKEIDRYRDSAQRKAVINSILAMFIEKTADKPGTLPMQNGAVRNDKTTVTDSDSTQRNFSIANQIPGVILEELQVGEKPQGFQSQGTDVNFGVFEDAILQTIAWANQIPPEILKLAFTANYSASKAAINEFQIYLNMVWTTLGRVFNSPIYTEWLVSSVLNNDIQADTLLESWRNPRMHTIFSSWTFAQWYGSIKPSTDMVRQANGSKILVEECWSTNAKEARNTSGTKFTRNAKRVAKENVLKAAAARPLLELASEFGGQQAADALNALDAGSVLTALDASTERITDAIEEMGVS